MANAPTVATYTNSPSTVALDRVRLEIGDTECDTAFLSDAEIRLALAPYADPPPESAVLRASAESARRISGKVARKINFSHGPVRKDLGTMFDHYRTLAQDLDRRASLSGVAPIGLADTLAEKQAADEDESIVQPDFRKGVMDNPRAGPSSPENPSETNSF